MTQSELLERFSDHLSKKQCETIEISGVCDNTGTIHYRFETELKLKENCTYYVSLLSFEGSSLFPNVTDSNNKFYYTTPDYSEKVITFETGTYNISDVAKEIKEHCAENLRLELIEATGKTRIKLAAGYKVDFTKPNNIGKLLGWDSREVTTTSVSPNIVDILASEKIFIYCNIIKGSYYSDGKLSTILYSFGNNKTHGKVISFRPNPLQEHVLTYKNISEIFITFKDDEKKPVTFQGSNVHLTLQIKQA